MCPVREPEPSRSVPLVLMDAPDDGICEEAGWVEIRPAGWDRDVQVQEARKLIAPFWVGDDGEVGAEPVGAPTVVTLSPDPEWVEDGESNPMWDSYDPPGPGARNFWRFDV
jgi:hypothetical protein